MDFESGLTKEYSPDAGGGQKLPERREVAQKSHRKMEGLIRELAATGKYERSGLSDKKEKIRSPEGEEYSLRLIENPKDPLVKKMHGLMVEEFTEDETETIGWLRHSIKEKLNYYHAIEAANGELAVYSNTQYLELEPVAGKEGEPREAIVPIWHIYTADEFRGKGLATELYQNFYQNALAEAQKRGNVLKAVIGEAVSTVETFLNRMGRKRMYFEDAQGTIHEVPYLCPPIDMSTKTGEPLGPAVPEHLMVRMVNGDQEIPIGEVIRMVWAMYEEYTAAADNYDSREAYENARGYNRGLLDNLHKTLEQAKGGGVFLLSHNERETKQKELYKTGKELREVVAEEEDKE